MSRSDHCHQRSSSQGGQINQTVKGLGGLVGGGILTGLSNIVGAITEVAENERNMSAQELALLILRPDG